MGYPSGEPKLRGKLGDVLTRATTLRQFKSKEIDWANADSYGQYFWQALIVLRLSDEARRIVIRKGKLTQNPPEWKAATRFKN